MAQADLEQRLKQAEEALERSERLAMASRYAGAIMHEVNNPLEAITNLVYLTKLQKDDPEQVLSNMGIIEEQLITLGKVTSQALTFHRNQAEAREFDLVQIAESALKLHAAKLYRRGVAVHRRFRGPAVVKVHASELLQVVSNLLLNAVEVLPGENGRIHVSVMHCSSWAHLSVGDNGPGIPEDLVAHLFQPYTTTKPSGNGLGLWLSNRIVGRHRGLLRFRTCRRPHRAGTIFRISLPLHG